MPIYEYSCEKCGHHLELIQKMTDDPLRNCPDCHQPSLRKLVSAAGFRLKGTGWYATDFKGGSKKAPSDAGKSPDAGKAKDKSSGHGCGASCGCVG